MLLATTLPSVERKKIARRWPRRGEMARCMCACWCATWACQYSFGRCTQRTLDASPLWRMKLMPTRALQWRTYWTKFRPTRRPLVGLGVLQQRVSEFQAVFQDESLRFTFQASTASYCDAIWAATNRFPGCSLRDHRSSSPVQVVVLGEQAASLCVMFKDRQARFSYWKHLAGRVLVLVSSAKSGMSMALLSLVHCVCECHTCFLHRSIILAGHCRFCRMPHVPHVAFTPQQVHVKKACTYALEQCVEIRAEGARFFLTEDMTEEPALQLSKQSLRMFKSPASANMEEHQLSNECSITLSGMLMDDSHHRLGRDGDDFLFNLLSGPTRGRFAGSSTELFFLGGSCTFYGCQGYAWCGVDGLMGHVSRSKE